ncbi:MAG: xanthine dehydrogenase family protein molybdopterin-binding subunit [Holophaga sp.]|nr:xanthine dehydrogenase family protein molybdopterin-binding subunit [Holophaga sp.]
MTSTGQPVDRVDGRAKVTGGARYAAEHTLPGLLHAVLVTSTVAHGRIATIHTARAERMRGVALVMTHLNAPRLQPGHHLNLLQDDQVMYNNQPVALVLADTLEHAQDAARAVMIAYAAAPAALDFDLGKTSTHPPEAVLGTAPDTARGDPAGGWDAAVARVDAVYTTPMEHHNPMEPHATIAHWDGQRLTLYDSTQYVSGARRTVSGILGIPAEQVQVLSPFVGGGFGCKGRTWSHVLLAAMASRQTGRPVKLVLERSQMFGMVGHRPLTEQRLRLGAAAGGRLTAVRHEVLASTSFLEDWIEPSALITRMLYASDSQQTSHRLVRLHHGTPTYMRAPGKSSGSFALECAMDELAYAAKLDPIALRLLNHADRNPENGLPWSSKSLRQCYAAGAERFGWARRNPAPRSMRDGRWLVGWGMATATYPANRSAANASARYLADGTALVQSGSQDLGTGTYTVMSQIAADGLGVPLDKVRFELGDSSLPEAPVSGGSQSVASVGPAVRAASLAAREQLVALAVADPRSPLHGAAPEEAVVELGWMFRKSEPGRREAIAAFLARRGGQPVAATSRSAPGAERQTHSLNSFGAIFAEVRVDPDLGSITVPRMVGAYGVGRLMNSKTAHSQLMGGMVMGLGMALLEKTELDPRTGRAVNGNLAEYHVPVNADIGSIDIIVVDEADPYINSLGAKGVGEVGIVGVAAAIGNAVYHATGRRIRDLPITLDQLL